MGFHVQGVDSKQSGFGKIALTRAFVLSVLLILVVSAGAKLLSALFPLSAQTSIDGLFGFQARTMWWVGGLVDIVFALALCAVRHYRIHLIIWMGALFVWYHLAILQLDSAMACPCFGNAALWMGLSERQLSNISFFLAAYMLFGGLALWLSILKNPQDFERAGTEPVPGEQ